VRAEAGVSCAKVARFCARLGLEGAEFLAGIPGTMGGALAMNAGCYNSETWEHIVNVETITRTGEFKLRPFSDFKVAYREVSGPQDEYFIAGYLKLKVGNKEVALDKIRTLLERRALTQPTGDHSCGSVFRNPPGDYAGRLIEITGLKNLCCGGARVSEKHANFIVNDGNASAADVEELIEMVAAKVKNAHGIELIKEVKIVGMSTYRP
jgi:UDP-N-acetylmuramate dehydrogenase